MKGLSDDRLTDVAEPKTLNDATVRDETGKAENKSCFL